MCRISGAARYEIGRGGGGREKKKEKWSRANAEPLHHRGRRGDDNRKVVSFRGKKKKNSCSSPRVSHALRVPFAISSFRFVLAKRTSF